MANIFCKGGSALDPLPRHEFNGVTGAIPPLHSAAEHSGLCPRAPKPMVSEIFSLKSFRIACSTRSRPPWLYAPSGQGAIEPSSGWFAPAAHTWRYRTGCIPPIHIFTSLGNSPARVPLGANNSRAITMSGITLILPAQTPIFFGSRTAAPGRRSNNQ
jgi:hypothetical protein